MRDGRKKRDHRAGIIDLAKNMRGLAAGQLGTPSTVLGGILGGKVWNLYRMNIFFLKLIYGEDGNFIPDEFYTVLYHREVTFFALFLLKKVLLLAGWARWSASLKKIRFDLKLQIVPGNVGSANIFSCAEAASFASLYEFTFSYVF